MRILFCIYELGFADNIGIGFLSAVAKNRGHETYFMSMDKQNLLNKISELHPDVVAYSATIIGYNDMIEKNKIARKFYDFISIMGGPYPTFYPEDFKESGMNAYCIGEGEGAFDEFLERLENNKSYSNVANLITKNTVNPIRPLEKNLDNLPFSDRDLIISNTHLKDVSKKTFFTSRGCPFSCSYCFNNFFNNMYAGQKVFRRFSVDRVIEEIKYIGSKYRMDFIKFGDDLFALRADDWLKEFNEKYKKEIGLPFNCYLRLDYLDDNILELLKDAGCFSVHLSIDSTSNFIRENVLNRKVNKKKNLIEEAKKIKEKYGINTFVNYMLSVPESTIENDLETIAWSKQAKVNYSHYTTAYPIKKTDLYTYCEERNFLPKNFEENSNEGNKFYSKSELTCFTEKEKDIRYNVLLLGSLLPNLNGVLYKFGVWLIKNVKPNFIFKFIWKAFDNYQIKHKIYRIKK